MGALPNRKISKSKRGKRRSHLHLNVFVTVPCPQCHKPHRLHHACLNCGYYRDIQVIEVKAPREKKGK